MAHRRINAGFTHGIAPKTRIKAKVPVELLCPGAPPMRTTTDEISLSGRYVETMFTMDVGTRLMVTLSIGGGTIHANGAVVTKYPQVGNGIDFIQIHPNDNRKLNEFISEHQQEDNVAGAGA